jgi:hypothetical protein
LWAPKLDNLLKHKGRKKAIIAIPCICKAWEFYMKKDSTHAKKRNSYVIVKRDIIAKLLLMTRHEIFTFGDGHNAYHQVKIAYEDPSQDHIHNTTRNFLS